MAAQRQFCHRVIVANQTDRLGIADFVDDFDATSCFGNTKATACKDFFVTLSMEFGESLAELKFLAVNVDGAIGVFSPSTAFSGKVSALILRK